LKIKIPNWLITIDLLMICLSLVIFLAPSSIFRIILGIPFLVFFPGFMLVAALFPLKSKAKLRDEVGPDEGTETQLKKKRMDGIERIALSFGMSLAVVALMGLALNYTPWGIVFDTVFNSTYGFTLVMSVIAILRDKNARLIQEVRIRMPGWEGSPLNKALSVILFFAIIGTIGVLFYTVSSPKVGEKFTEFYILGLNGIAEEYPLNFVIKDEKVISVEYGTNGRIIEGQPGKVILGIVNHEQRDAIYSAKITVGGQQVPIILDGETIESIEEIKLAQGEKWEKEIGYQPERSGDNQKVEFLLYVDGNPEPENSLHLWANVKEQE